MSEFSQRLRDALKTLEMTQQQAAEATGITLRSVKNYVLGNTTPDAEVLQAVCRGLGIAPSWFLFGEGEMFDGEAVTRGGIASREWSEVIGGMAELNDGRKNWLRAAVWLQRQIQARDQSERLGEEIHRRGAPANMLEEIAKEKRKLESIEQEIIAAFCDAGPVDPGSLSGLPGRKKTKKKPGKKLVPQIVRERRETQGTSDGAEEPQTSTISTEFDSALEKYEQAWSDLLTRIGAQ